MNFQIAALLGSVHHHAAVVVVLWCSDHVH